MIYSVLIGMRPETSRDGTDNTRRQVLAAMGTATALGLAGCSGDGGGTETDDGSTDDDGTGDTDTETPTPVDPDELETGEFTASAAANPSTFDPTIIADATSFSTVGSMAYEGLTALTFDLSEFRSELATDWEQLDDLTFRFQLREGVQFHNGDEFVADDVAFSIERTRGTTNDADVAWIDNVEILGDFEIEVTSTEPHAPFLNDIGAVRILPHDADISTTPGEDEHDFTSQTLGTGPFTIDNFQSEDRLELVPFEDYWYDGDEFPGTAPWDRVTFRVVTEQVSQEEAMAAGELDMIDNPAPFELDQWENQTGTVVTGDAVGFDFVTYPVQVTPFDNAKFRRGLTRLIPRGDVIQAIFGGNATELGGPISPGLGAYWDQEHEQNLLDEYVGEDPEAARTLIQEGLDEAGVEAPVDITMVTNVNRTRERWMEVVQQVFDQTDLLNAELDVRAFSDLVPFLLDPEGAAQSSDVVGIGWTGGSDPDGHVAQLLHSRNHVPDGFNWNLYENDEVDQLIDEGKTTLDVSERRQIYKDLQTVLAQEVPLAAMWTGDAIHVVNSDALESLDTWQPHPNASFTYSTLYSPHLDQMAVPPQS